jgi:hypothetical protein
MPEIRGGRGAVRQREHNDAARLSSWLKEEGQPLKIRSLVATAAAVVALSYPAFALPLKPIDGGDGLVLVHGGHGHGHAHGNHGRHLGWYIGRHRGWSHSHHRMH